MPAAGRPPARDPHAGEQHGAAGVDVNQARAAADPEQHDVDTGRLVQPIDALRVWHDPARSAAQPRPRRTSATTAPASASAATRSDAIVIPYRCRPFDKLPAGEGPRRETQGEVLITVDGAPLDCGHSLAVRNPSPTGPAWGYGGSGPTQLALAILLAVTDEATAERFYQPFPWSVIAPIEADRWALDAGDVLGGLEVGGRLGRTTSSTWRWTRVVRAGCLGTQRICPAAVRPPCRSSPLRAAPRLFPVFVRRTRPWRASSSCGFRRRASGVAAGRFRGPSSGLQVDFEHAWGRGTLPVDEDPGARDGRAGS